MPANRSADKREPLPPTERQKTFLEAVARLSQELGRPPSATEIGLALNITRTGARRQLQILEKKGLLQDVPRVVSSGQWAVTVAGLRFLPGE